VDLLVATDAEAILGIGDWGVNGFAISVGKLAVYTAAAGIDPDRVIPDLRSENSQVSGLEGTSWTSGPSLWSRLLQVRALPPEQTKCC
jgi:hypothetical protein